MTTKRRIRPLADWGVPLGKRLLIAGPCSVESREQVMQTALGLARYEVNVLRAGIWKPRTHPGSFEGPGVKGLKWLKAAGKAACLPVATEVATPKHVEQCLKHGIDMVWVGARTTVNPFAVQAIADALKGVDIPMMVKNPINPDIDLWCGAIERIRRSGTTRLIAVHRGFSEYRRGKYRNQPIWRIPIELRRRVSNIPIICDPSHICGKRELISSIAQEAMDFLFDGLMIEVHIDPKSALSDARQQITPRQFGMLTKNLKFKEVSVDEKEFRRQISLLRKEIDVIDGDIIGLLARRMEFVRRIGATKRSHDVSAFQPRRWEEMLRRRIKAGSKRNLSEGFILRLYQQIHEEALRHQEEV